ncbi:hypothetical protein HWV62_7366 [Athelia sp. TMB]|nr:hypothetical protein HWV62_7366 [Athelia sp. TMB]
MPFRVRGESGLVFVDQNGFRMQHMPLLPLIRAVELLSNRKKFVVPGHTRENVNWRAVDFITDRSNLRKLLRWIDGSNAGRVLRIDAELAGDGTVLLNRWERRTREYGQGSYGFNLEKATTKEVAGCEGASSHHRIVKYDLGGLAMVVRCEVDAFIPCTQTGLNSVNNDASHASNTHEMKKYANFTESEGLTIRYGGLVVPHSSLIELKSSAKIKWPETYPQMWLSQTPWLYKASHNDGQFHTLNKTALESPELAEIAEKSKVRFERLRDALRTIKNIVVNAGLQGRLSFVLERGELKVYDRESKKSCLPPGAMALFN